MPDDETELPPLREATLFDLLLCHLLRMILLDLTTTFLGSRTKRNTVICSTRQGQQQHTTTQSMATSPASPAHDEDGGGDIGGGLLEATERREEEERAWRNSQELG
jgi:hypothetical protein